MTYKVFCRKNLYVTFGSDELTAVREIRQMSFLVTMSLVLCGAQGATGPDGAGKVPQPIDYWYGNPPRLLTAATIQRDLPRAALATLDANERAALEKLKASGFTPPNRYFFKWIMVDGMRVVIPPQGIILATPQLNRRPEKVLRAKDLAPLADLLHVVKIDLGGKWIGDDALDLLRNMGELSDLGLRTRPRSIP